MDRSGFKFVALVWDLLGRPVGPGLEIKLNLVMLWGEGLRKVHDRKVPKEVAGLLG